MSLLPFPAPSFPLLCPLAQRWVVGERPTEEWVLFVHCAEIPQNRPFASVCTHGQPRALVMHRRGRGWHTISEPMAFCFRRYALPLSVCSMESKMKRERTEEEYLNNLDVDVEVTSTPRFSFVST